MVGSKYTVPGRDKLISVHSVGDKDIEDIVVTIPFSKNCNGTNLTSKIGTVLFDETTKVKNAQHNTHFWRFASGESLNSPKT
jgi:hypothetical protein